MAHFEDIRSSVKKHPKENTRCEDCKSMITLKILCDQPKGVPLGIACACKTYFVEKIVHDSFEQAQRALMHREGITIEEAISQSIRAAEANQRRFAEKYKKVQKYDRRMRPFQKRRAA